MRRNDTSTSCVVTWKNSKQRKRRSDPPLSFCSSMYNRFHCLFNLDQGVALLSQRPDGRPFLMTNHLQGERAFSFWRKGEERNSFLLFRASAQMEQREEEHPTKLIPELLRLFYGLGWVTGTGGGISIRKGFGD